MIASQVQTEPLCSPKNIILPQQPIYTKNWSIYSSLRGKQSMHHQYEKNITIIGTSRSLEEFFSYYIQLKKPSQLPTDTKLMIFEQSCKPMWEEWMESGSIFIQFKCKTEMQIDVLDEIWEYIVFSLVGNQFHHEVIGVILCKRVGVTLVELWLRDTSKHQQIGGRIESMIHDDLPLVENKLKSQIKVKFKMHKVSINKNSTMKGAQNLIMIHPKKLNSSF